MPSPENPDRSADGRPGNGPFSLLAEDHPEVVGVSRELRRQRHCLCIGNSDYGLTPGGWDTLSAAAGDAARVSRSLQDLSFTCKLVQNANVSGLREALTEFMSRLNHEVFFVVLYFAGHGIEHNGQHILLGVEAQLAVSGCGGLATESILAELAQADLRRESTILLVLDCCRSHLPHTNRLKHSKLPQAMARYARAGQTIAVMWGCPTGEQVMFRRGASLDAGPFSLVLSRVLQLGYPQSLTCIAESINQGLHDNMCAQSKQPAYLHIQSQPAVELWQHTGSEGVVENALLFALPSVVAKSRSLKREDERLAEDASCSSSLMKQHRLTKAQCERTAQGARAEQQRLQLHRRALDKEAAAIAESLDALLASHSVDALMGAPEALGPVLRARQRTVKQRQVLHHRNMELEATSVVSEATQRVLTGWFMEAKADHHGLLSRRENVQLVEMGMQQESVRAAAKGCLALAASTEMQSWVIMLLVGALETTHERTRFIRSDIREILRSSPQLQSSATGRAATAAAMRAVDESLRRDTACQSIQAPCGGCWLPYHGDPGGAPCEGSRFANVNCSALVTNAAKGFRCSRTCHTICFRCANLELEMDNVSDSSDCFLQ